MEAETPMTAKIARLGSLIKLVILRGVLSVGGVSFALVLAELSVRIYDQRFAPQENADATLMMRGVPWGWSYVPNARSQHSSPEGGEHELIINSLGLRDREYALEKPERIFRILLLGDSYGDDARVPPGSIYHELAEERLNQELDTRIEVLNASVEGWSTDQQLVYYEEKGRQFESDLVLLAFCMCNDTQGNYEGWSYENKPTFGMRDGNLVQVEFPDGASASRKDSVVVDFEATSIKTDPRRSIPIQIRKWASENLRLFRYVRAAGNSVPSINRALIRIGLREDIRQIHQIFMVEEPPEVIESWIVTKALLERLHREVRQDGAELAVFVIHSPYQVETTYWWESEFEFYPAMNEIKWDLRRPDFILNDVLEDEGIPYFFLVDEFANYVEQTGNLTTWEGDPHWNLIGHELAGRLMAEWLLESGLLSR